MEGTGRGGTDIGRVGGPNILKLSTASWMRDRVVVGMFHSICVVGAGSRKLLVFAIVGIDEGRGGGDSRESVIHDEYRCCR